jgi:hypothetical protein
MRLFGIVDAEFSLRDDLEPERGQHFPELTKLAGIAAGDDELFHKIAQSFNAAR